MSEEREVRADEPGDLVKERLRKLGELKALGIEPYGRRFPRTHSIARVREEWEKAAGAGKETAGRKPPVYFGIKGGHLPLKESGGAAAGEPVTIAGRVMSLRLHGKAQFADVKDETGRIQLYAKVDLVGEKAYAILELLDMGDIVGVKGVPFKTRTGELTVEVRELAVLAKALRPLPEKWHGLRDVETRYRQRHVDLTVNEDVRKLFSMRSRIVKEIRRFLDDRGFSEVETPMLHPIPGGATGRAFRTHADALDTDLYLRIAPELYLKRLLVGGFERVYEINRSFRNEGLSPRHNPEFTMLELYAAYADYEDMMSLAEELIPAVAERVTGSRKVQCQGKTIDLGQPWKRVTFRQAMRDEVGIELKEAKAEELREKLLAAGVKLAGGKLSRTRLVNLLAERLTATEPTFIIDYPAELCPLAKTKAEDTNIAERFELFIGGYELANAYSEQNDPQEQRRSFLEEAREAETQNGKKTLAVDEDYVGALEFGMPPAGGMGIGIDRLVMLLADVSTIREVIFFPQLRPEKS